MRTHKIAFLTWMIAGALAWPAGAQVTPMCSMRCPDGSQSEPVICGGTPRCYGGGGGGGNSGGGLVGLGEILSLPFNLMKKLSPTQPQGPSRAAQQAYAQNEQGLIAYNAHDWATAAGWFKRSLDSETDPIVKRNLAQAESNEGADAYHKGDYTAALNYFRQALANDPASDPGIQIIRDNVAEAQEQIHYAQVQQDQLQRDKVAAANIQQSIQSLAQSLSAAPSSDGLKFNGQKPSTGSGQSGGLTFISPNSSVADNSALAHGGTGDGKGTSAFGTKTSNPSGLDFMGADSHSTAAQPVTSATDQLASIAANSSGSTEVDAKANSNCGFDKAGCSNYTAIDASKVRAIGQTPGAADLTAHIPDAGKNDGEIQKSVAYYQKLDNQKNETQTKLAALQQQIDSGAGDTKLLDAKKATLKNDLNLYVSDQLKTQEQIKKRLVAINVPWTESPSPTADTTAAPANGAPGIPASGTTAKP